MQVVIMAGGAGTRLGQLTENLPKALLPVDGSTVVGKLMDQLADHGMHEAVLCIGPERFTDVFRSNIGERWRGIPVRLVPEDEPLGTAGGLRLIDGLDADFMVVNCDIVTELDFAKLFQSQHDKAAAAMAATGSRVEQLRFGMIEAREDGQITVIREKPEQRHEILLGAYVLNRAAAFTCLPSPAARMDMPSLLSALMARGSKVCRFHSDAAWCDVGTPEDYEKVLAASRGQT